MNNFYFPLPEKSIALTPSGKPKKSTPKSYDCETCQLYNKPRLHNPKFNPSIGSKYNGLVFLADNPSVDDDIKGVPFTNEKAKIIRSVAFKNDINIDSDCAVLYALRCQSGKVTEINYKCCRCLMANTLNELKPKLVIVCGSFAFKYLMNLELKYPEILLRNRIIPNFEFNTVVFPIINPNNIGPKAYHLEYALRNDLERIFQYWKTHFHKRTLVNRFLMERKILDGIKIINVKKEQLKEAFQWVFNQTAVAFDYEATNASPYDHDFEQTHMSFGNDKIAWVLHEELWLNNPMIKKYIYSNIVNLLTSPAILKIIQNSKFEDLASRFLFGMKKIINVFCPMLASHVIDERKGGTGLDFQNLVRFGIPPYNKTIKSFLEPKTKDDKINTIRQAPYEDMIQYAGLDIITTFAQWKLLDHKILNDPKYPTARENYEFLLKGHWTFANMSQRGVPIHYENLNKIRTNLNKIMWEILEKIYSIPEVQQYNEFRNKIVPVKKKKTKQQNEETKNEMLSLINKMKERSNDHGTIQRYSLRRKFTFGSQSIE